MSFILRLLGVSTIAALAGIAAAGFMWIGMGAASAPSDDRPANTRTAFAPLPPVNTEAGPSLLDRSPFAPDRSAFDRENASTPPPPPIEVKLTGIFKVGKELRASLLVGGQSIVVRRGDETAAGRVARIEADAVHLEGPTQQRLEMFK